MRRINWKTIVSYIGVWVLIAFFFSVLVYFSQTQLRPDQPPILRLAFLWQAIMYGWAILFPAVYRFAARFRVERGNWRKTVPLHLAAAVFFVLAHTVLYTFSYYVYHGFSSPEDSGFSAAVWRLFFSNWLLDSSMYFVILCAVTARDYSRRFQAERLRSSELDAALAASQLQALKMQIHPHFLFNTLNSISTLIHEDVRAADEMIARLGDFLRLTLENSGSQHVALSQELNFVNAYLEIESVRFGGDRLTVEREIDPAALRAQVPNLILQPLIENAIKHGISRRMRPGKISIRAKRGGGGAGSEKLRLEIEDNGAGLQNGNSNVDGGIGLANTRARLFNLYGNDQKVEMSDADPQGTIVTLEIPFEIGKKDD